MATTLTVNTAELQLQSKLATAPGQENLVEQLAISLKNAMEKTPREDASKHRKNEYIWSPLRVIWMLFWLSLLLLVMATLLGNYSVSLNKVVLKKKSNEEALRRINNENGSEVSTATMMAHTDGLPTMVEKAELIVARDLYSAALAQMWSEIGMFIYVRGINDALGRYIQAALSQIIVMSILMCVVIVMAFYLVICVVLQLIRAFTIRRVIEDETAQF